MNRVAPDVGHPDDEAERDSLDDAWRFNEDMQPVGQIAPPCRVCGHTKWVAVYNSDKPEDTICIECCHAGAEHADGEVGHRFSYEPYHVPMCVYCGCEDHWREE